MSVYKRGEIYHYKFELNGRTFRRTTGTSSKREAEEVEREARRQAAKDIHAGRSGKPVAYTFGDALIKWLESGAPKSMLSHINVTRVYLANTPLHQVVPAAHDMKAAMLKKGKSKLTINRRLSCVRRVLNLAYKEWEWLPEPLGQKIKLFSEKGTHREVFLSREEVDRLLSAIGNMEVRKMVVLAAYTGLRRGELLKLRPKHWQKPYIVLTNKTKGKKGRTVPVIEGLHEFMEGLPLKCGAKQVRYWFEKARELIGMPGLRLHDLRHTFVSWLAKDPRVPVAIIQNLAGHSSIQTTNKYMHLRGDTMELVSGVLGQTKH
jgi:integrase